MSSCTSSRDCCVQTSPWLSAKSTAPSTALSRKASSLLITEEKTMLGDLPPSSTVTGMRLSAASLSTAVPVGVDPVKATLAMPLL